MCNLCFVSSSHVLPAGGLEAAAVPAQLRRVLTAVSQGVLGEDECMTAWHVWAHDKANAPAPHEVEEHIDWHRVGNLDETHDPGLHSLHKRNASIGHELQAYGSALSLMLSARAGRPCKQHYSDSKSQSSNKDLFVCVTSHRPQ